MNTIGDREFIFSQQLIRQALDNLLYSGKRNRSSSLTELALVEEFLSNPITPHFKEKQEFALNTILTDCIREQFFQYRRAFELGNPDTYTTQAEALDEIAVDAHIGSPELLGWGWLYYHYVRVDLHITVSLFSQSAHVDPRSLRRYQQYGLARLTTYLIEQERVARTSHRQLRLLTALPMMTPMQLFGRDAEIHRIQKLLSGSQPHHIHVIGASGAGKTVLVQEMVRWQIMSGCFDAVVWLDKPASIGQIRTELEGRFPALSLREITVRFRLVVVLDGVESLRDDLGRLEQLLGDLSLADVYLINQVSFPLLNVPAHIFLPDLHRAAAMMVSHAALEQYDSGEVSYLLDDLDFIFERVGGNPRAIKQAIYDLVQSNIYAL